MSSADLGHCKYSNDPSVQRKAITSVEANGTVVKRAKKLLNEEHLRSLMDKVLHGTAHPSDDETRTEKPDREVETDPPIEKEQNTEKKTHVLADSAEFSSSLSSSCPTPHSHPVQWKNVQNDGRWDIVREQVGWLYATGDKELKSWYWVPPGGRCPEQGGKKFIDYVSTSHEMKQCTVRYCGWGGDEAYWEREGGTPKDLKTLAPRSIVTKRHRSIDWPQVDADADWKSVKATIGWRTRNGTGLIDFYHLPPGGKCPKDGGKKFDDYVTTKLEMKFCAVTFCGWKGDEQYWCHEDQKSVEEEYEEQQLQYDSYTVDGEEELSRQNSRRRSTRLRSIGDSRASQQPNENRRASRNQAIMKRPPKPQRVETANKTSGVVIDLVSPDVATRLRSIGDSRASQQPNENRRAPRNQAILKTPPKPQQVETANNMSGVVIDLVSPDVASANQPKKTKRSTKQPSKRISGSKRKGKTIAAYATKEETAVVKTCTARETSSKEMINFVCKWMKKALQHEPLNTEYVNYFLQEGFTSPEKCQYLREEDLYFMPKFIARSIWMSRPGTFTKEEESVVINWLRSRLPDIRGSDLCDYKTRLLNCGFYTLERLNYMKADDITFMRIVDQRILFPCCESPQKRQTT